MRAAVASSCTECGTAGAAELGGRVVTLIGVGIGVLEEMIVMLTFDPEGEVRTVDSKGAEFWGGGDNRGGDGVDKRGDELRPRDAGVESRGVDL